MALELKGKTALVTGAGSGICLELTKRLVAAQCNVLAVDIALRDEAKEAVAETADARAEFVQADVTDWTQLGNAFKEAIAKFGRLDIVIPGAGLFEPAWSGFWEFGQGVDNASTSNYRTLEVNITHPIRATQLAIDSFMRQELGHGVVVIISSIAGQLPLLPTPLYSTSKHAMAGFVRSLTDLEPQRHIRVNAVAPGVVKTPIWSENRLKWVNEDLDEWVPMERVVDTILELITNKDHVGGTILEVGVDNTRSVAPFHDPGPSGRGHTVAGLGHAMKDVYGLIDANFGK